VNGAVAAYTLAIQLKPDFAEVFAILSAALLGAP
jgi:cytochrome c-type biogenesis protein CcmH/NrfG